MSREQRLFRQNLEEMRLLKQKEEEEMERILKEEQDKLTKHQNQMRLALADARAKLTKVNYLWLFFSAFLSEIIHLILLQNVFEGRDRQIENRRRLKELEAQQLATEKKTSEEIRLAHKALEDDHKHRKAQMQRQYGDDLKKQAEFARRLKVILIKLKKININTIYNSLY